MRAALIILVLCLSGCAGFKFQMCASYATADVVDPIECKK